MYHRKRKQEATQSFATVRVAKIQNTQITPGSERGGIGRTKKITGKTTVVCHNLVARLPRPQPGTEQGGIGRTKYVGPTPIPA